MIKRVRPTYWSGPPLEDQMNNIVSVFMYLSILVVVGLFLCVPVGAVVAILALKKSIAAGLHSSLERRASNLFTESALNEFVPL